MNRIALSIALALGIASGAPALVKGSAAAGLGTSAADPIGGRTSPGDLEATRPDHPDWFSIASEGHVAASGDPIASTLVVKGRRSYSERRALDDARRQLERAVIEWLVPDVSEDWNPPAEQLEAMIEAKYVDEIPVDPRQLGLDEDLVAELPDRLFVAALKADVSSDRRDDLIDTYRRQVGAERITLLGGLGVFVLACLAILAVYIRADEATKGYYTNRLRLVALAAAGAAGAAVSRFLV